MAREGAGSPRGAGSLLRCEEGAGGEVAPLGVREFFLPAAFVASLLLAWLAESARGYLLLLSCLLWSLMLFKGWRQSRKVRRAGGPQPPPAAPCHASPGGRFSLPSKTSLPVCVRPPSPARAPALRSEPPSCSPARARRALQRARTARERLVAIQLLRQEALDPEGQLEVGRGIISTLVEILFEERDLEVFREALITLAHHHQLGYSWRTEARLLRHMVFWVRRGCRLRDARPLSMATRRAALRLIMSFDATSLEATIPFLAGCFGERAQSRLPLPLRFEAWRVLVALCRRSWKAPSPPAPLPDLPLALARLAADPDPRLSAAALKFFKRHRERIPLGNSQPAVRELAESACHGMPAARNCLALLATLEHRTALLALARVYFHKETRPAVRDQALLALTRVAAGKTALPVS